MSGSPLRVFHLILGFQCLLLVHICMCEGLPSAPPCQEDAAKCRARRGKMQNLQQLAQVLAHSWRGPRGILARPGMRGDEAATIPARSWPPWRGRRCLSAAIGRGRVRRPNPEPLANGSGIPGVLVAALRCVQEGVCAGRGRNRWRTVWPLWRGRRCASAIPGRRVRRLRQQSLAVGTWLKLSWRDKPCSSARSGRRAQKLGP